MDKNIITYLACICFLFIFGRIFLKPIKKVFKLVINSVLGRIVNLGYKYNRWKFWISCGAKYIYKCFDWATRTTRSSLFNNCKTFNKISQKRRS